MTHVINTAADLSECELSIVHTSDDVQLIDAREDDETFGTIAHFSTEDEARNYAESHNGKC